MAEKSSLSTRTFTFIASNLVVTSTSIKARASSTIILVLFTIFANKPIYTDTLIPSLSVLASPMVLTRIVQCTLINIFQTIASLPVCWALASVGVHSINTFPSILANIASTIIYVLLAVATLEAIRAGAVVLVFPCRGAQASVFTWRWAAGDIGGVTVLASPAVFTVALVPSISVLATTILTGVSVLIALIHVDVAVWAFEAFFACAAICVLQRRALGSISTGLACTVVLFCAMVS